MTTSSSGRRRVRGTLSLSMKPLFIVVGALVFSCAAAGAAEPAKALPRSAPEAQGVASGAILDFVNEAEAKIDALHSVMVVRHHLEISGVRLQVELLSDHREIVAAWAQRGTGGEAGAAAVG